MGMSMTLREYLDREGVDYDVIEHPRTTSTMRTAESLHIPGDRIVKTVIFADEYDYLMVVVPATHLIEVDTLGRILHRDLNLVKERELSEIFTDCEVGSIPPLGAAFGIPVLMDESLSELPEVYFEAGDHSEVVHVSGEDFMQLMESAEQGHISHHM